MNATFDRAREEDLSTRIANAAVHWHEVDALTEGDDWLTEPDVHVEYMAAMRRTAELMQLPELLAEVRALRAERDEIWPLHVEVYVEGQGHRLYVPKPDPDPGASGDSE